MVGGAKATRINNSFQPLSRVGVREKGKNRREEREKKEEEKKMKGIDACEWAHVSEQASEQARERETAAGPARANWGPGVLATFGYLRTHTDG